MPANWAPCPVCRCQWISECLEDNTLTNMPRKRGLPEFEALRRGTRVTAGLSASVSLSLILATLRLKSSTEEAAMAVVTWKPVRLLCNV